MSTERYTPDESALIATYWDSKARQVDNPQTSEIVAEARRGIAKVKADAIREAADDLLNNPPSVDVFGKPLPGHIEAQRRLLATADRIEAEA